MAQPELIGRTFVELADTLVDSYDLSEFLHGLSARSVELLGVTEAGIVLADRRGDLQVLASSSERMHLLELLEVQRSSGPCDDAFRSGNVVREIDLAAATGRWPGFREAAVEAGFRSVYAIPMRLRSERIGALNLFAERPDGLSGADEVLAQALADVATIGILHARVVEAHALLAEQLTTALDTRVVIEQANGVLAEQGDVEVDVAFATMRRYARSHNRKLSEVAADVVARRLSFADVSER
jgi:transcriptional regulator with GAF, ATPase, and Fis domain